MSTRKGLKRAVESDSARMAFNDAPVGGVGSRAGRRVCVMVAVAGLAFAAFSTPISYAGPDEKPSSLTALQKQLRSEYRSGNYEAALKTAEKIQAMQPGDVYAMYNVACMNCLTGKHEEAYKWLEKAIDAGYRDANGLIEDSDFRTIRGEDRFRELVRRIRAATPDAKKDGGGVADVRKKDPPAPVKKAGNRQPEDEDEGDKPKQETKPKKVVKKLSPQEASEKINELTQKLIQVSSEGEKEKALKLATEAYEIAKASEVGGLISLTSYNMACMHSLKKNTDEAFKYLEEAIGAGGGFTHDMAAQMEGDSDLDHIRKDARYKKLLEKAKNIQPSATRGGQRGSADKKVGFRYEVTTPKGLNKSKAAPLVVALHGFGSSAAEEKDTWREAAASVGAILLTPQGTNQRGSSYNWGDNLDEIEENIMSAIDDVMDKQKIDKKRIVIAGFSQGGQIAYALALRNPDTFCGVIPVCGLCKESESAFDDDAVKNLRVCILYGSDDEDEILDSNKKAAEKFKQSGAKVTVKAYDGGHAYPSDADEALADALKFVLNR